MAFSCLRETRFDELAVQRREEPFVQDGGEDCEQAGDEGRAANEPSQVRRVVASQGSELVDNTGE